MFKALVLSTFVVATVYVVQHGYEVLLQAVDTYVQLSYGQLANNPDPGMKQTGKEVTSSYAVYRAKY